MIAFSLQEFPHTGAMIGSTIFEKLKEYYVKNKIMTITLDNASSNNVAVELLKYVLQLNLNGAITHNRCACHIISLIIQEVIKSIQDGLETIKWIVGFIFCSPSRNLLKMS